MIGVEVFEGGEGWWFDLGWWLDELWGGYFLGGHESMGYLNSEPVLLGWRGGGIIAFAFIPLRMLIKALRLILDYELNVAMC